MPSSDHQTELDSQTLFHDISRCAVIQDYFRDQAHFDAPCRTIIRSQLPANDMEHQLPEPWRGDIVGAPILFVSSNPSIGEDRNAIGASSADEVLNSYANAFNNPRMMVAAKYSVTPHGIRSTRPVQYWSEALGRAGELLERVVPGRDYALTEVVHCKSRKNTGVKEALNTCVGLYLDRVLTLLQSCVIILYGDYAASVVAEKYRVLRGAACYEGPTMIGGRERFIIRLGAPGSNKVRTLRDPQCLPTQVLCEVRALVAAARRPGVAARD
jgi:uracil-DNA glycosylase